jgi:hypothetical protein
MATGKFFGRSKSRYGFRTFSAGLVTGTVFTTLVLLVLSCQGTQGDDGQRWMIPGRVARALSEGRNRPASQEPAGRWMANVSETGWQYIVIHHSASDSGSVDSIHEEHRRRRDADGNYWLGIGYHFVIGNGRGMQDGSIEPTFRWNEQIHGAHSGNAMFNTRGIGVCLIGNFEKARPTNAQLQSVRELVRVLAIRHRIPRERLLGHSSVKATACPGKHFPLNEIRMVIPERQS